MSTKNKLSYEQFMEMISKKDLDNDDIYIEGAHLASDEYIDEANQLLRLSAEYLKKISDMSSVKASGLVAG